MFDSTILMNFKDFNTFGTLDLSFQTKWLKCSRSEATFPLDLAPYEGGEILWSSIKTTKG